MTKGKKRSGPADAGHEQKVSKKARQSGRQQSPVTFTDDEGSEAGALIETIPATKASVAEALTGKRGINQSALHLTPKKPSPAEAQSTSYRYNRGAFDLADDGGIPALARGEKKKSRRPRKSSKAMDTKRSSDDAQSKISTNDEVAVSREDKTSAAGNKHKHKSADKRSAPAEVPSTTLNAGNAKAAVSETARVGSVPPTSGEPAQRLALSRPFLPPSRSKGNEPNMSDGASGGARAQAVDLEHAKPKYKGRRSKKATQTLVPGRTDTSDANAQPANQDANVDVNPTWPTGVALGTLVRAEFKADGKIHLGKVVAIKNTRYDPYQVEFFNPEPSLLSTRWFRLQALDVPFQLTPATTEITVKMRTATGRQAPALKQGDTVLARPEMSGNYFAYYIVSVPNTDKNYTVRSLHTDKPMRLTRSRLMPMDESAAYMADKNRIYLYPTNRHASLPVAKSIEERARVRALTDWKADMGKFSALARADLATAASQVDENGDRLCRTCQQPNLLTPEEQEDGYCHDANCAEICDEGAGGCGRFLRKSEEDFFESTYELGEMKAVHRCRDCIQKDGGFKGFLLGGAAKHRKRAL
ncbi:hypothetical protein LTR85_000020 [Meristemomyces frigidus]|nr:hypothetical protein LTR85_000020 [Meristemomyces frigidus]